MFLRIRQLIDLKRCTQSCPNLFVPPTGGVLCIYSRALSRSESIKRATSLRGIRLLSAVSASKSSAKVLVMIGKSPNAFNLEKLLPCPEEINFSNVMTNVWGNSCDTSFFVKGEYKIEKVVAPVNSGKFV